MDCLVNVCSRGPFLPAVCQLISEGFYSLLYRRVRVRESWDRDMTPTVGTFMNGLDARAPTADDRFTSRAHLINDRCREMLNGPVAVFAAAQQKIPAAVSVPVAEVSESPLQLTGR